VSDTLDSGIAFGVADSGSTVWFCGGTWSPSSFTVTNTTLTVDCRSGCGALSITGDGSVIEANNATLSVSNLTLANGSGSTITGGGASTYGGNLLCENSDITLDTVTLRGAEVTGSGGGVYAEDCTLDFTDVSLSSNDAATNGGGLYAADSALTFNTVDFVDNLAGGNGAGMYLDVGSNLDNALSTLTFSGNLATGNGGAAYVAGGNSDVVFTDASVSENTAVLGGGIYMSDGVGFCASVTGSDFSKNVATSRGGGLYIDLISTTTACVSQQLNTWPSVAANNNTPTDVYGGGAVYTAPTVLVCENTGCATVAPTCGCAP